MLSTLCESIVRFGKNGADAIGFAMKYFTKREMAHIP